MKYLLIACIHTYRWTLRPLLGQRCRFYPDCSSYGLIALKKHGAFKGLFLIFKRLVKCHPFHPGGVDPVP